MDDTPENHADSQNTSHRARRPFGRPTPPNLGDLPDRMLALLRQSPVGEIEQNLKSLVMSSISKLDLVTREEFEIQQAMLEKLRARVEKLEAMLDDGNK